MDLKLAKVILWPKNPENAVREVPLNLSGVSVITGWSQRGKSSLIHIIDYCLGSWKCAIPVGQVRDKVAWFGVLCVMPRKRMILLARKNPGGQVQSSEMVLLEGVGIEIPTDIDALPKVGHEAVLKRLNQMAGLPSHGIALDEAGFAGPPSFRDMAAFLFQPQHIIANPHTLFFKADTSEHREKLIRSVLPYVLGAVDASTLEAQAQLRHAETELKFKQSELDQARRAAAMWLPKLQHLYAVARDQDLLANAPDPKTDWTPDVYRSLLSQVSASAQSDMSMQVPKDASGRVVHEITALRQETIRLSRMINDRKRRLEKIQAIRASAGGYIAALQEQSSRLAPVGWFAERVRDLHLCPLCGNSDDTASKVAMKLAAAGDEIALTLAVLPTSSESLEAETVGLERDIADQKSKQRQVEERLRQWSEYSAELKELNGRRDTIQRFLGQLQAALDTVDAGSDTGQLTATVSNLEKSVASLQRKVNETAIRVKMETAIRSISRRIGFYAKIMDIEHAERSWQLDPKSLTLRTADEGERTDYLWEIGSAANWMGYHIATVLALHEHFRSVPHNPVPKFLVLDQPSQAFFPEGVNAARKNRSRQRISDDLERLKKLFAAIAKAVDRTNRGLQIIVLEHAGESVWHELEHVKQVAEWRENDALIPLNWK